MTMYIGLKVAGGKISSSVSWRRPTFISSSKLETAGPVLSGVKLRTWVGITAAARLLSRSETKPAAITI